MLVLITAWPLAASAQSTAPTRPPPASPTILWSKSQDGLSLGIELPSAAFIFTPTPGWKGPLIIRKEGKGGELVTSNAAGTWSARAIITVHVKNTSDHVLWWAADHAVWKVALSGAGAPKPEPWTGPKPPSPLEGPSSLDPGAESQIQFHISEAGDIWPPVPQGKYIVTVTCSPDSLLKLGSGGEGHWIHPYDVPGFWGGTLTTPAATIEVKYP